MITVKKAVQSATQYLIDVFPGIKDVQLEEVELSDDEATWQVTLSFLRPIPFEPVSPLNAAASIAASVLGGTKYERLYKFVTVDAKTGKCQSIKIRQLQ